MNRTQVQKRHLLSLVLVAVALELSLSGCGPSGRSQLKIIGGAPVEQNDPIASSVAALVTATNTIECSAVAVDTYTFVTAAHCIYGKNLTGWTIKSGLYAGDGESISVISGQAHAKYDPSLIRTLNPELPPYDIAIIKTEEPTRSIIPVPIIRNHLSQFNQNELKITVAGFGRTDGLDPESTGRLQKASIPISAFNDKAHEFTTTDEDGKMGCHADSGAPAFIMFDDKLTLVGTVSRGDRKCASGTTVYTDISQLPDYVAIFAD